MHKLDDYLKYYQLKQNDTIIDLGAGHGEFEETYMQQIRESNSTVYLIEGFDESCAILRNKFQRRNFNIINTLIGDCDGSAEFVVTSQPYCNFKRSANQDPGRWNQKEIQTKQVNTLSLNSLLNITGPVGFIKCDIEGSELEGFLNCTKWPLIESMAIGAYHIVNNNETWKTLKPFFEYNGYEVIHESNPKPTLGTDQFHNEDLLYVRRK